MSSGQGQQQPAAPASSGPGFRDAILGLTWTLTIISIVAVTIRFYFRKKYRIPLSSDDWLMLVAEVFQIIFQAFVTTACADGLGNPLATLMPTDILSTNRWAWISTPFSNVVSVIARISITILLIRIFGTRRWYKWSMIILTGLVAVLGVTNIILIWAMCSPPEALWDKSIPGFKCLDSHIQQYLTLVLQAFFALSDVVYVIFPVIFVYKLNMATRKKVGLAILLGLSLITGAAAFSKVVTNIVFSNVDPLGPRGGDLFTLFGIMLLITSVEQSLVITIGCVPTLRPIALIKIPFLSSFRETLASLLSTRRSGGNQASKNSSKNSSKVRNKGPSHDSYEDLELSNYGTSMDNIIPPHSTTTVHAESGPDSIETGKHIHRTDDYTITYAENANAMKNTRK